MSTPDRGTLYGRSWFWGKAVIVALLLRQATDGGRRGPTRALCGVGHALVWLAAFSLLLALLGGCKTADTIQFNRGEAAVLYAEAKSSVRVLFLRIDEACAAKKLKPDACANAQRIADQFGAVDRQIQETLRNPETEFDWATFMKALELIAKVASIAL